MWGHNYIDLHRGGDLATLVHLAAGVIIETLLISCAYHKANMGAVVLFGVSVQSLADQTSHPYCACWRSALFSILPNALSGVFLSSITSPTDKSLERLSSTVKGSFFVPFSPYLSGFSAKDLDALVNDL